VATTLEQLRNAISRLKLDDSLLFLNHLLAVSRGEKSDAGIDPFCRARKAGVPAFLVHFFAKQLLLHASNLGIIELDGQRYLQLLDLFFQLDDPICSDPEWETADPSGFFERMLGHQLPAQRRDRCQLCGLGLGLFRDVGAVRISDTETYGLRSDIERHRGMSVGEFVAMGFVCGALNRASHRGHPCPGTFDHVMLAEANVQGVGVCRPEVWPQFLTRVACTRDEFRRTCENPLYRVSDARYTQFEFNPLVRFPVIDVGQGRFVTVDPHLLAERTTLGLFYDLFERDRTAFSRRFGYVFDRFVGNLLGSVCPSESLWWEGDPNRAKPKNAGKVADWAYKGASRTILFECKSLRPPLELVTFGSDASVQATRERIVSAITQLSAHAEAIRLGKWANHGLAQRPEETVGVVVTYGQLQTVNGPFFRRRILNDLRQNGVAAIIPHVVLSITELDEVVRLVELGHHLDDVIATMAATEDSFVPLSRYADAFRDRCSISNFSYTRGSQLMESVTAN